MAKKKTSKKLATLAGKFLRMDARVFRKYMDECNAAVFLADVQSLAATALSQYEAEQKKK